MNQDKGEEKPFNNLVEAVNVHNKFYGEKDKGETRELFEWVKVAPEDLPVGNKSMPIRWQDDTGEYRYDTGYVDFQGGFGEKILIVASSGWYKIGAIEWLRPLPKSALKEEIFSQIPDIEPLIEKFLPNQFDLSSYKPKEILFMKSVWQHGAIVMFHHLKNASESSLTPKSISDSNEPVIIRGQVHVKEGETVEEVIRRKKSASLKPNKLTDSDIEKMAEEFSKKPYYRNGDSLSVAPQLYLKRGFIAGAKEIIELKK